jgi:hypothetical protein
VTKYDQTSNFFNFLKLTARENFSDELEAHLSWIQEEIEGKEEVELEITWTPTCEGAWRYMLHLGDNKTVSRDVPVVFKSVAPFTVSQTDNSELYFFTMLSQLRKIKLASRKVKECRLLCRKKQSLQSRA